MNRTEWLTQTVLPQIGTNSSAVEVGVWRGHYSMDIHRALKPKQYWGVDPYLYRENYADAPDALEYVSQHNLDQLHFKVDLLFQCMSNSKLLRTTGQEAAAQFEDQSLDFVYIDGDHSYEFVSGDCAAWWPKIRKGGILAGHDYTSGNPQKGHVYGVIEAVTEHCERYNLTVQTTQEQYATWWVTK